MKKYNFLLILTLLFSSAIIFANEFNCKRGEIETFVWLDNSHKPSQQNSYWIKIVNYVESDRELASFLIDNKLHPARQEAYMCNDEMDQPIYKRWYWRGDLHLPWDTEMCLISAKVLLDSSVIFNETDCGSVIDQ